MNSTDVSAAVGGADNGLARLASRARNAEIAIFAYIGVSAIMLGLELLELAGVVDLLSPVPGPLARLYGIAAILFLVVFIVSVVLISMWIYRAHANLRDRGIELETSPGWAVGWFFVPIMNLFKPFQAMRELWSESHFEADSYGDPAPGDIAAWWACWIIGGILSNVSMRISSYGAGDNMMVSAVLAAVSTGVLIASAFLLRKIIREITAAQNTVVNVREVFD
ncbi:MAG: hypothetical protein CL808_08815 [Citromicrobium sp.]|nr:hypothetical protein [Citromicrobium sp.]